MKRKDNARGFIRLFSLECLVIALIIFPLLHTHAAPHQANEREEAVQEIVESRDSAVILFGRAQNMFALLFDDFLGYSETDEIQPSGCGHLGPWCCRNVLVCVFILVHGFYFFFDFTLIALPGSRRRFLCSRKAASFIRAPFIR